MIWRDILCRQPVTESSAVTRVYVVLVMSAAVAY